jgi:membrane protease YdiL (CAAX protease family)
MREAGSALDQAILPMDKTPQAVSSTRDAVAVGFALGFPTVLTWVYFIWLSGDSAGVQQVSAAVGKVVQFAFPLVWVVLVQRRQLRLEKPSNAGLAIGAGFGVLVVAAMMVLYHAYLKPGGYFTAAAAAVNEKVKGIGFNSLAKYAALGVFYSVCHSFFEEYYWRWFVFAQLRRLVSLRAAIAVSSLGFMAHHVLILGVFFGWASPATYLLSLCIAVGGAAWAWLYDRTGSIYGPWLSHLLVDAGIFLIGYDLVRFEV